MSKTRVEGVEAARRDLPSLLEQAHQGKPTVVTKRGVPYAAIVPLSDLPRSRGRIGIRNLRGSGKGLWGSDSRAAIEQMRREWR